MFVVFEGGDGAGKTTQARRLADQLTALGRTVTTTYEPGGTPLGERVRTLLLDPDRGSTIPPRAEALLFLAARAAHAEQVIWPALNRGEDVICDRWVDSTLAYQGHARGLPVAELATMSAWSATHVDPDLVIILDVDPAVGLARTSRRPTGATFFEVEKLAFHHRVRVGFLQLAAERQQSGTPWPVYRMIPTTDLSEDQVFEQVSAAVDTALASREFPR